MVWNFPMLSFEAYIACSVVVLLVLFVLILFKLIFFSRKTQEISCREEDLEKLIQSRGKLCNCSRNQDATNLGWKLLCEKLSEEKMLLLQEANDLRRINFELKVIIQGYDETLEAIGFA